MKTLTLIVIAFFTLAFSAHAFERPRPNPWMQQGGPMFERPTAAAKWRFCCKNESGRACHASKCSNCMSFCSGDMLVDPSQDQLQKLMSQ